MPTPGRPSPTEVGHHIIDDAHTRIAALFSKLDKAAAVDDRHLLTTLAEELFQTFETHFADEERLMLGSGYDDERRKAHVRIHNSYTENLITFVAALPAKPSTEALATQLWQLRDAFHDHLIKSDMDLARFLKSRTLR